jgi:hypothetical protein
MDGQTDRIKLMVTFRNFAKATKNDKNLVNVTNDMSDYKNLLVRK